MRGFYTARRGLQANNNPFHPLLDTVRLAAKQFGVDLDVLQLEPKLGPTRADALDSAMLGALSIACPRFLDKYQ